MEDLLKKSLAIVVFILIAVISFTLVAEHFMKPETYNNTIITLDEKKENVLKLTASATAASAIISAIPDDTATPISDKLADLSGYFLLTLCVLYAEKYLLTIIGFLIFRIIVPIICIVGIIYLIKPCPHTMQLEIKLIACAVILFIMIPLGTTISNIIDSTYAYTIQSTLQSTEQFSNDISSSSLGQFTQALSSLIEKASGILSRFIEALAVIIVTSCIIPLVSVIFSFWLIKLIITWGIPVQYLLSSSNNMNNPKPKRELPSSDAGRIPPKFPPEW